MYNIFTKFFNKEINLLKNPDVMTAFCELLSIPSVKGKPEADAPFGADVKRALTYTLNLAESFGFKTNNYDNYVGEVVFGEGKPFGVLCHLDVVPVGNLSSWNTPPFTPTEIDSNLYARGALDDKCGAIATLYALKRLKDEGITPTREIRLILGCDEESGWGCIEHYKKCATLPEEGISPDADFPVIYAEKGIVHAKFTLKKLKPFDLSGGTVANVVCDHCKFKLNADYSDALAEKLGIQVLGEGEYENFGVSAHGSTPDKGVNALKPVFHMLSALGYLDASAYKNFFLDAQSLTKLNDETGFLTFSPDVAQTDDENLYLTVDIRYPATYAFESIAALLSKLAPYETLHRQLPLYADKNGKLVQTLLNVYNQVTGDNAEPIAIGGGTYARALKSAVAFGPSFGEEGYSIHQPNEYIPIENFYKLIEILYRALKTLCC